MKLTNIEKEIILLKAIYEIVEEMLDYQVLEVLGNDSNCEIHFSSDTSQKYFNIILVDFLSNRIDKYFQVGIQSSFLNALGEICESPNFDVCHSIKDLKNATDNFTTWLDTKFSKKIWLPAINLELDLSLKRSEFIKICGNISKHNFIKLSQVIIQIKKIFQNNNIPLTDEEVIISLEDFYKWFHEDVFGYHSSTIAEFINNIRWGIFDYFKYEFYNNCYQENGETRLCIVYPYSLENELAKYCYRELLRKVSKPPHMLKFRVTDHLKKRY